MRTAVAYLSTLLAMLVLDFAWLGTVGGSLFKRTLGDVMAPQFSIAPAVIFYAVYVVGILYFATLPGLDSGDWTTALLKGALFGFFAYLTYDMTNLATLRNYSATLAMTDLVWGTVVTGAASTFGFFVTDYVMRRFG